MDWILWVVVGYFVAGGLVDILVRSDKPTPPLTTAQLTVRVTIRALIIAAIIWVGILN